MASLILDCRWLGHAGVGRATEHLLRGLSAVEPRAEWTVWGPASASSLAPGFRTIHDDADPRAWAGQRCLTKVPRTGDVVVFMHQTRPLISRRSVTVIHDTTQLRTSRSALVRAVRRRFLMRAAAASDGIITVSEWSKERIRQDLGVAAERIRVVGNPADAVFGERVMSLRDTVQQRENALYVGSFAPHKNVNGLVEGFRLSALYRDGGGLVLAGARPGETGMLGDALDDPQITVVERCPQDDLDMLFAQARILVQPSFEEGFGLPVWEAMSAGIPVASSTGGALASVGEGAVTTFDPRSPAAIASAIDQTVAWAQRGTRASEREAAARFLRSAPSPEQYARAMEDAVLELVASR